MRHVYNPEVCQTWKALHRFAERHDGEIGNRARVLASNLLLLTSRPNEPDFRAIVVEQVAALEEAIRTNRQSVRPH